MRMTNYMQDSKKGLISVLTNPQGNCQNMKRAKSEVLFTLEAFRM